MSPMASALASRLIVWTGRYSMALLAATLLGGCVIPPSQQAHSDALTLDAASLAQRQVETRRFDTADQRAMLSAAVGVMQDLGFTIEESSVAAGLLNASKIRNGQVIRASLVVRPSATGSAVLVRINFQSIGMGGALQAGRAETIGAPHIYQGFFDRLSESLFLQAHSI
jgi:hypothetical protein